MINMSETPMFKIMGRFNFLTWSPEYYNILFIPYDGAAAMIIARNLPRSEMDDLYRELNRQLDITIENLSEGV